VNVIETDALCYDENYAKQGLGELGISLRQKAGKMSGGQQAHLALTLALTRRLPRDSWTHRSPGARSAFSPLGRRGHTRGRSPLPAPRCVGSAP